MTLIYAKNDRLPPEAEWALRALMQARYSSVSDLAGWNKYDRRKCLSIVTKLQGIGYVVYQEDGKHQTSSRQILGC